MSKRSPPWVFYCDFPEHCTMVIIYCPSNFFFFLRNTVRVQLHEYYKIINLILIGCQHFHGFYEVFWSYFCTNVCIFKQAIPSYQNATNDKSNNSTDKAKPAKPVIVKEPIAIIHESLTVPTLPKEKFDASVKK